MSVIRVILIHYDVFLISWDVIFYQFIFPLILTDIELSVNSTGMIKNGLFIYVCARVIKNLNDLDFLKMKLKYN